MSALTRLGVSAYRPASGGGASFVASAGFHVNSSGTVAIPVAAQAGDIALFAIADGFGTATVTSPGNGSAAWTQFNRQGINGGGISASLWYRVLNANDISNGTIGYGGPVSDGTACVVIYRGIASAAYRNANGSATTSIAVPSYTPAGNGQGAVIICIDLDDHAFQTVTAAGFTQRLAAWPWNQTNYAMDNFAYAGGITTVNIATSTNKIGWIVELLS